MKTLILASTALALASTATAQWVEVTPTTQLPALSGLAMTEDPITGGVLVFGGNTPSGPFGLVVDETWRYDGTTWTQLSPTASPTPSQGHEMVYDSLRSVFVTYGSLNTSPFGGSSEDKTWEFDGTTWTEVFPTTTPGGLGLYGMTFDSARNRTVLYGGVVSNGFALFPDSDTTWEFDGNNWAEVTTVGSPGPLERPAMCYHTAGGVSVLFGGIDVFTGGVDTTWLYDGTSWTAAGVAGTRPPARTGPEMVYDSVREIVVMTGGQDFTVGNAFTDTWEFDLANLTWTQVPSTYAEGRREHGLAFMPSTRQVVMHGGQNNQTFTPLAGTFEYGAKSETFGAGCAGTNGTPALDAADAPRFGETFQLDVDNLEVSVSTAVFVLSLTELAATPLDGIGMTGCNGYLTPDVLALVAGAAGSASYTTAMPTTISLMGTVLVSQALGFDPGLNALSLSASNAHRGTLGN